jgi:hypothetical protein
MEITHFTCFPDKTKLLVILKTTLAIQIRIMISEVLALINGSILIRPPTEKDLLQTILCPTDPYTHRLGITIC